MSDEVSVDVKPRHHRPPVFAAPFLRGALLDAAHDAYADWLRESFAVERLYGRWSDAPRDERAAAFASYSAALEREERAAEVYADMVRMAAARPDAA